jgi:hypothetical protein
MRNIKINGKISRYTGNDLGSVRRTIAIKINEENNKIK